MNYLDLTQSYIAEIYPLIVYGKPRVADLPAGAVLGTWAYSVPGKMRFILDRDIELATGVLPADLTRVWLRDVYKLPLRRRNIQFERHFTVPLHAVRGDYGDCSYVDIKRAFLRILSLGYDVEYLYGKFLGTTPITIPPEIIANKYSYSIAVSMSGTPISKLQMRGRESTFKHEAYNIYSNPCLFNLAQDTLNAIGAELIAVLEDKCVYANTDGFIIQSPYEQFAIDIIQSWGFEAAIKHQGKTVIRGVASYRIGDYQTKRFNPQAQDFTGKLMERSDRLWLKARWMKLSRKL